VCQVNASFVREYCTNFCTSMRASATVVLTLVLGLLGLVRGQGYSFLTLGDWGGADTKPEVSNDSGTQ